MIFRTKNPVLTIPRRTYSIWNESLVVVICFLSFLHRWNFSPGRETGFALFNCNEPFSKVKEYSHSCHYTHWLYHNGFPFEIFLLHCTQHTLSIQCQLCISVSVRIKCQQLENTLLSIVHRILTLAECVLYPHYLDLLHFDKKKRATRRLIRHPVNLPYFTSALSNRQTTNFFIWNNWNLNIRLFLSLNLFLIVFLQLHCTHTHTYI